jgi:hypothetical protein
VSAPEELSPDHLGEPRWAMVVAVLTAVALHATLPTRLREVGTAWSYPVVVSVLLVVLIVGDPGRIDKRDPWLRVVNSLLIAFITLVNAQCAIHLVRLIINGSHIGGPDRLLGSGAAIWSINVIAFGLWYWDLDQGGPAERANRTTRLPAFLFPEMLNPQFVREGWYPTLIDYMHTSFATAAAFSPTDVSALKHWSKALMTLQAAVSLLLAVLVVARAINLLPP